MSAKRLLFRNGLIWKKGWIGVWINVNIKCLHVIPHIRPACSLTVVPFQLNGAPARQILPVNFPCCNKKYTYVISQNNKILTAM